MVPKTHISKERLNVFPETGRPFHVIGMFDVHGSPSSLSLLGRQHAHPQHHSQHPQKSHTHFHPRAPLLTPAIVLKTAIDPVGTDGNIGIPLFAHNPLFESLLPLLGRDQHSQKLMIFTTSSPVLPGL